MRLSRYPRYKSGPAKWVGDLPDHWTVERIKYSITEKRTRTAPDLPAGAISYGRVVAKDGERLPEETKATYQEVLAGEYLINPINLNYDLVSLRTALSSIDVVVSPAYIVAKANTAKLLPSFGSYFLYVFDIRHMKSLGAGVRQTIGFKDIGNCYWALPPMGEQEAITEFLDGETSRIDSLIEKKGRFIGLLKERLVTHALQATAPRAGWSPVPFWAVATSKCVSGMASEGLLSVYLGRGVIPYSEGGGLVHKPAESLDAYQLVELGDFVMNNQQAWRGSVGVSVHRGIVSPAYLVFELNKAEIDPAFANYAFRSRPYVEQFMLASLGVGDIQRQIKWHLLRRVPVSLPPLEEQRSIAVQLDREKARIDLLISKTERSIELLREHRSALITAAVTGKIDVRGTATKNMKVAA